MRFMRHGDETQVRFGSIASRILPCLRLIVVSDASETQTAPWGEGAVTTSQNKTTALIISTAVSFHLLACIVIEVTLNQNDGCTLVSGAGSQITQGTD